MNIFEILQQEHRQVESLFADLENAENPQKMSSIFEQITQALKLHTLAEELSFYPVMYEYDESRNLVEEAEEEHNETKILLEELAMLNMGDREFMDRIGKLKKAVQHHVQEEESEVFPMIQNMMDEDELQMLSQEFQTTKKKLQQEMMSGRV